MLPNGGFPPIVMCEETDSKEIKEEKKGFFYSTDINNLNIRKILKENDRKMIKINNESEELDVVDSL